MQTKMMTYRSPDTETAAPEAATPTATPPAASPAASSQGMTVEVVLSACVSTGVLNPGEIVHCEDAQEALGLIKAGIVKASSRQPQRVMPSTRAIAAAEAAVRARSGEDVPVLQGFEPEIHEENVQTARRQREQEDKASKPPQRKRK